MATLVVLLALAILLAPRFIHLEQIGKGIQADFSKKTGGELKYNRLTLSVFPRPQVKAYQLHFITKKDISGNFESLAVYPRIFPLLRGKIKIARLRLYKPSVTIRLPGPRKKTKKKAKNFEISALKEKIASFVNFLAVKVPGMNVQVKDGKLELSCDRQFHLAFLNIKADIAFPPDKMKVNLSCTSRACDRITLAGWFNPKKFRSKGQLILDHLRPQLFSKCLFPRNSYRIGKSNLNLNISFRTDGIKNLHAEVLSLDDRLILHRKKEMLVLLGRYLNGRIEVQGRKTSIFLDRANLTHPLLKLSGKLVLDETQSTASQHGRNKHSVATKNDKNMDRGISEHQGCISTVSLDIEGKNIDVPSTRKTVLTLAGNNHTLHEIFGIVKGGKVPHITFQTSGNSLKDLKKTKNIVIKGHMLEGEIFIPDVNFDLTDVNGDATISNGILYGKHLVARLGKSRGDGGKLKVGLTGKNKPFHLDILLDADLTQLPHILKQVVHNGSFIREINLVDNLKGTATGKLILGESLNSIKPEVEVSKLNLSAHYKRVPFPFKISGGQFFYRGSEVGVKDLDVNYGQSHFSQLSAGFNWNKVPSLTIDSCRASVFLDEIFPWLKSFEKFPEPFANMEEIKGKIRLTSTKFKGPLFAPEDWNFQLEGQVENLAVKSALFRDNVKVSSGGFKITPERVSFSNAKTSFLDASLDLSGTLTRYMQLDRETDLTFQGNLQSQFLKWISNRIHFPQSLYLRPPLVVSTAHFVQKEGAMTSFTGNIVSYTGPELKMDILKTPGETVINDLRIYDREEESEACFSFRFRKKAFSIGYHGKLAGSTLNKLFAWGENQNGGMKGDFNAEITLDQPSESYARGSLTAEHITLPRTRFGNWEIENVSLDGKENTIHVNPARITWQDIPMTLHGDVNLSEKGLLLNLGASADNLDWAEIDRIVRENVEKQNDNKTVGLWDIPILGRVSMDLQHFKYGTFTWSPFQANISFGMDTIDIEATRADLCGISTPGKLEIKPANLSLDCNLVAKKQDLNRTLNCLSEKEIRTTGTYNLKAKIHGEGTGETFSDSLQGETEFISRDGRIYQLGLLSKILAIVNVGEIVLGKLPDLDKEGFSYKSIKARGTIKNGKLTLKKAIIDGSSMDIVCDGDIDLTEKKVDLVVLVAPLKTADRIIKRIPIVSHITRGMLVSIPVKVQGDLQDPDVTPLSPTAVGSELLGVMKRIVNAPIHLIKPILP